MKNEIKQYLKESKQIFTGTIDQLEDIAYNIGTIITINKLERNWGQATASKGGYNIILDNDLDSMESIEQFTEYLSDLTEKADKITLLIK